VLTRCFKAADQQFCVRFQAQANANKARDIEREENGEAAEVQAEIQMQETLVKTEIFTIGLLAKCRDKSMAEVLAMKAAFGRHTTSSDHKLMEQVIKQIVSWRRHDEGQVALCESKEDALVEKIAARALATMRRQERQQAAKIMLPPICE